MRLLRRSPPLLLLVGVAKGCEGREGVAKKSPDSHPRLLVKAFLMEKVVGLDQIVGMKDRA